MQRILGGYPTLTLEEAVENYMAMSENIKRHHFTSVMITAKWLWKEILKESLWQISNQLIEIDKASMTIKLPCDLLRLLNISVVDSFGNLQSFSYADNMNTISVKCPPKKCSCTSCNGKDSYCEAIDNMTMLTETVTLNGFPYNKRTWVKKEQNGTLNKVIELPYLDTADDTVKVKTSTELLCQLETTETGCLKATPANFKLLQEYCHCFYPGQLYDRYGATCKADEQIMDPHNRFGQFKEDSLDKSLIHIRNTKAESVIISYQATMDKTSTGQFMVPEWAMMCFNFGMYYYTNAFKKTSRGEKDAARRDYRQERKRMDNFTNPVSLDVFLKMQSEWPKWG